ncbi:rhomboid family intramembrane serine protease [Candidatus Bathyarchaeota archaeon]|nr:rhomboid family intramembrane serine protease [Candidatus Bathyarchaeota archaeon]
MLPIGDENTSQRTFPIITCLILASNLIVFLMELEGGNIFLMKWSFIPPRFLANPLRDFPTIFTAMFMHSGWLHLLGNLLYLWIFGDNVEDRLGHAKFLLFYLLCGVIATFSQMFVDPITYIPNLGASGAIAGVLGAYIIMFPRSRVYVLMGRGVIPAPAILVIGFWIILQLISGLDTLFGSMQIGGVAYMAHIGGFVAGLIFTLILNPKQTKFDY